MTSLRCLMTPTSSALATPRRIPGCCRAAPWRCTTAASAPSSPLRGRKCRSWWCPWPSTSPSGDRPWKTWGWQLGEDITTLVGGLEHVLFSHSVENNHPNWQIFFRGVKTTNQNWYSRKLTCWPWKSPVLSGFTNLPTPMTARVYEIYWRLTTGEFHVPMMRFDQKNTILRCTILYCVLLWSNPKS